jgi:hypothetical protein
MAVSPVLGRCGKRPKRETKRKKAPLAQGVNLYPALGDLFTLRAVALLS